MNIISVDVGQQVDPTSIVVWQDRKKLSEKINPPGTPQFFEENRDIITTWVCPLIERLPLGTPYSGIGERVHTIINRITGKSVLLVDATGVGRPVIEMMQMAKLNPLGIIITNGKEAVQTDMGWNIPKQELVSALMIMYQAGEIRVAASLELAPLLLAEMVNFTAKNKGPRVATYEAHRSGDHDDIVLAMAQAAWYVRKYHRTVEPPEQKQEYDSWDTYADYRSRGGKVDTYGGKV